MHTLTKKRVNKFAKDFGFEGSESENFERYVAAMYLYQYLKDYPEAIEKSVLGGGQDEGVDIAAVVVNNTLVFEPEEIDELISERGANSAKVIFIQAKTSEGFNSKLIAKFLHGVESITKSAMDRGSISLPHRLVDISILIDRIAENGDKFSDTRIPCDLFYVTTSSQGGDSARSELQVTQAMDRIASIGIYTDTLNLKLQGHEDIAAKQRERFGPQNIKFNSDKNQAIPASEGVEEAYIGLISPVELMKLITDENSEIRPGIFDDNVRLDLGANNAVNRRIAETLHSEDRQHFPFLNNGITIVATELRNSGGRFFISGYQIVNGGQTSHQLVRWACSAQVRDNPSVLQDIWVPVKIISSSDPQVRTRIAVATNLQTAISASDIQSSSTVAKDVEEYFEQSGNEGLRYERQRRGSGIQFARTRVLSTSDLNRAVASTLFGDSSRAIGSPKTLDANNSSIWDDYPVEAYYYAAWIVYRIDRYFGRNPESNPLKAAKYHIAMAVSLQLNNSLSGAFEAHSNEAASQIVRRTKGLDFSVDGERRQRQIEDAIYKSITIAGSVFRDVLLSGRSLRKDDVRSRKSQEEMLAHTMQAINSPENVS